MDYGSKYENYMMLHEFVVWFAGLKEKGISEEELLIAAEKDCDPDIFQHLDKELIEKAKEIVYS